MIIYRNYNENEKIDKIWYQSSNIVYSECIDKQNDFKTLFVTFKNGATYKYSDVNVQDYVMFAHGGLDNSNGKALNEFIKKKGYPCERVEDKSTTALAKELNLLLEKDKNKNLGNYIAVDP